MSSWPVSEFTGSVMDPVGVNYAVFAKPHTNNAKATCQPNASSSTRPSEDRIEGSISCRNDVEATHDRWTLSVL